MIRARPSLKASELKWCGALKDILLITFVFYVVSFFFKYKGEFLTGHRVDWFI